MYNNNYEIAKNKLKNILDTRKKDKKSKRKIIENIIKKICKNI